MPRRPAPVLPIPLPQSHKLPAGSTRDNLPLSPRLLQKQTFPPAAQQPAPITKKLLKSRNADLQAVSQSYNKNQSSLCISLQPTVIFKSDIQNKLYKSRSGRESPIPFYASALHVHRSSSTHNLDVNSGMKGRVRIRHASMDDRLQSSHRNDAVSKAMDKHEPQSPRTPLKKTSQFLFPPLTQPPGCTDQHNKQNGSHSNVLIPRCRSYSGPFHSDSSLEHQARGSQNTPSIRAGHVRKVSAPIIQVNIASDRYAHNGPITKQPQRSKLPPPISPKPKRKSVSQSVPENGTKQTTDVPSNKSTTRQSDVIRLQPVILDIEFGEFVLTNDKPCKEQLRIIERPRIRDSKTKNRKYTEDKGLGKDEQDKKTLGKEVVIRDIKTDAQIDAEDEGCCRYCIKDCVGDLPECLIEFFCCD